MAATVPPLAQHRRYAVLGAGSGPQQPPAPTSPRSAPTGRSGKTPSSAPARHSWTRSAAPTTSASTSYCSPTNPPSGRRFATPEPRPGESRRDHPGGSEKSATRALQRAYSVHRSPQGRMRDRGGTTPVDWRTDFVAPGTDPDDLGGYRTHDRPTTDSLRFGVRRGLTKETIQSQWSSRLPEYIRISA
jgi:hypothetical protein